MNRIVANIFEKLLGSKKKLELIFYVPKSDLSGQDCFEIPNDLLVPPFVIKELRAGEFFLEDIKKQLTIEFPDFFIIIPPLQGCNSLSNTLKIAYPEHSLEAICLREVLSLLPIQKSLGIILPSHLFTSTSHPEIIQEILRESDIDYFVEFDNSSAFFNKINKSFRFTLVVFSKKRNDQSFTKFFKVPSFGEDIDSESLLKDFSQLLKQGGGKTIYGYVYRDAIKPESLISYDTYHPDFLKKLADINTYGEVRKLKNICSIMVGCKGFSQNLSNVTSQESIGIPLVQGRSILLTGNLDPEFLESNAIKISIQGSDLKYLQDGDLCIRGVTKYSDNLRCLVFAEITEEVLPLIASNSVIILRFNKNLEKEERDLTIAYLRSHFTDTWLKIYASRLSGAIRLTPHLLGELPVPCFDADLKTSFRGLTNAIKAFKAWEQTAENARNSIFDFETAQDSRLYLLATGREVKKRHEAAKLVDDFNYRIRTQFPHPIAYRWRTVLSSYPDLEGYKGVLRCAEALTCYLAHIAILFAESQGTPIQHLKTIAKNLSQSNKGTNFGDWKHIIESANNSKKFSKLEGHVPFYEVTTFLDISTQEYLEILYSHRNDESHDRSPQGKSKIKKAYMEVREVLENLLKKVEFISDYPLRYIEHTKRDSIRKITTYDYRDLMGDHPLVPIQQSDNTDSELEEGSLYLVDTNQKLYLLRPLFSRLQCPECGLWATFFLDKYDKSENSVLLKSLEHGHIAKEKDKSSVFLFKRWGFLE